jgi:hypothetical protein
VPSPRCKICIVCKFGSCHASFIFVPCEVYTLASSAALCAEFPATVRLEGFTRIKYYGKARLLVQCQHDKRETVHAMQPRWETA